MSMFLYKFKHILVKLLSVWNKPSVALLLTDLAEVHGLARVLRLRTLSPVILNKGILFLSHHFRGYFRSLIFIYLKCCPSRGQLLVVCHPRREPPQELINWLSVGDAILWSYLFWSRLQKVLDPNSDPVPNPVSFVWTYFWNKEFR